jgi:dienelactone hydrolase
MKHAHRFLSIVLWAAAAAAAARLQTASEPAAGARAIVDDLVAGRFSAVEGRFGERVAQASPAGRLREVWQELLSQVGAFRAVAGTRREVVKGYRVETVTCTFERAALDVRVAFDGAGKVAGLFFAPAADPTPSPAAIPEGLKERALTVGEGGAWPLPATLTLPASAERLPAVVLVHGSGPHDRDETVGPNAPLRDLALGLARRGIAVLRYEKRTKVYASKLSASLSGFTVNDETVADAQAAVALLAGQPEIDPARIFVLGHSLGGTVAPRIAAGLPTLAGVIVLAGGARPLEGLIVEQVEYLTRGDSSASAKKKVAAAQEAARRIKDPTLKAGETVTVLGAPNPASYWLDLRGYEPAAAAAALRMPFLVLQGGRDYQVTTADFALWKAALANRPASTCKLYPALNHLFMAGSGPSTPAEYGKPGHVADEVIGDIAGWILAQRGKEK